MSERFSYVVYDLNRKRAALEFEAFSDAKACSEFASWYNRIVRPSRWEARRFGRYFLFREARVIRGFREFLDKPVRLMDDDEVRLSFEFFRMCDPPATDEEEAELAREFDRLDGLDAARLARRGNQAA